MTRGTPLSILIMLSAASCTPRADDRVPSGAVEAQAGTYLEPPFLLVAQARGDVLHAELATRRMLEGDVTLTFESRGTRIEQSLPARTRALTWPLAHAAAWRVTARWADPSGVAGASTVLDSRDAPDVMPSFVPVAKLDVGRLQVEQAIPVTSTRGP